MLNAMHPECPMLFRQNYLRYARRHMATVFISSARASVSVLGFDAPAVDASCSGGAAVGAVTGAGTGADVVAGIGADVGAAGFFPGS